MTRFFLIRHAVTDAAGKRLSGRTPGVYLNEQGRIQAQSLATRLATLPITAVYSSPLERTLETSAAIAQALRLTPIPQEEFLEIDFGEWTDCSIEILRENPGFKNFNSFRSCTRIPGGELMLEAQTRIVGGLQKLQLKHPGETVAVVSHADLIKAAIAYYSGIPLDMFERIEISPASISIFELYEDTARILLLNNTGEIKS